MNTRSCQVALVVLALSCPTTSPATAVAGEAPFVATGSSVRVTGTSNLHDWEVEGQEIDGEISVSVPISMIDEVDSVAELVKAGATVEARVTVQVRSLASGKRRMDRLMHKALGAARHVGILYRLRGATISEAPSSGSSAFAVATEGDLTIAGVTRSATMEVRVETQRDNQLIISGWLPVLMSDFGVDPPKAMLGALRTGDAVEVFFRWVAKPTFSAASGH